MCKLQIIKGFFSKHFLPIGTVFIIPFGICLPAPAVYLHGKLPIVQISIITLFCVIGMKFRLTEIKSALRCYKEIALGLFVIIVLTPVVGTKLLMLPKFQEIPRAMSHQNGTWNNSSWLIKLPDFGPEEFRIGLQIFCTSPCASAFPTVVVTAANGNRALTLLVAVMATIISVFTVPAMATWLVPALQTASVGFQTILLRVVLFILLPIIVGRLLRFISLVKKTVVKAHTGLKFVTSGALLVIFWTKISLVTAKGDLQKFSPWMVLAVTALGTAVITSFLVITYILATLLRLSKESTLAVSVLSSARNSSIAIAIIENLPDNIVDKDLVFFPIVFVYLAMVVVINSYGSFMTIKQDDHDENIEDLEEKPLNENNNHVIEPMVEKHEIVHKASETDKSKTGNNADKLTLVVNPMEHSIIIIEDDIPTESTDDINTAADDVDQRLSLV